MLFSDPTAELSEVVLGDHLPLRIDLRLGSRKATFDSRPTLVLFTTQEKARAYGRHVEEHGERPWRMFALLRLTQAQIREEIFKGNPYGMCAVDPSPDGFGKTLGVNGLHLV